MLVLKFFAEKNALDILT